MDLTDLSLGQILLKLEVALQGDAVDAQGALPGALLKRDIANALPLLGAVEGDVPGEQALP